MRKEGNRREVQSPQMEALRFGIALAANITDERVNGKVSDFFLWFMVQTSDDEAVECGLEDRASDEGDECVCAYRLGQQMREEFRVSHFVGAFMQDEAWIRDSTTNRIDCEVVITVGVLCTGERLVALQEVSRDAAGLMFLGELQLTYGNGMSPVMDAFLMGLDCKCNQTDQRWSA